jgi:aspartyl-tRNA(Asn)/glutamyl-tRNA(Gln) amidotransferase subunit B
MGHPGTLPVPNALAVKKAALASIAIGCTVQADSHFDRKHYFYPDLPSGFQISQYDFPLALNGEVTFHIPSPSGGEAGGGGKVCRIRRLHLENDAGKLVHRGSVTLCDFNRAGTPLMEIVTEPDLRNAAEAVAFAQELRRILVAVSASEADMFKGMMRFDASISLREIGSDVLNPRSEIKNLNSFKALERALVYEEKRLRDIWEKTGKPLDRNITVGWLDDAGVTRELRDKESADDYRYFPEPDIPPLKFTKADIENLRKELPVLPKTLRDEYRKAGLSDAESAMLLEESALALRFEAIRSKTGDAKRAASIVLTQMTGMLNAAGKTLADAPSVESLLALVAAVDSGEISANKGKEVLEAIIETGKSPNAIISEGGFTQISDTSTLEALVKKAIDANPSAIENYKKGKTAALGAIVGWVMKETKGQANPGAVNEILAKKLAS